MIVAIIDYGSGNLRSAARAFERVAGGKYEITVSSEAKTLCAASHIVLPGVGTFDDCMEGLRGAPGILEALRENVIGKGKPFLGICVGMQMLFETGMEHGEHEGLGWLKGKVIRINNTARPAGESERSSDGGSVSPASDSQLKIPHMGWNELNVRSAHPLLAGIPPGAHAYFVHSYHAVCGDEDNVLATVDYGSPLTAVVAKGNIMGTQFHPEKSQETGLRLIENFLQFAH